MFSRGRISIVFLILFLLAAFTGGFFVLKDKKRTVDVSPEPDIQKMETAAPLGDEPLASLDASRSGRPEDSGQKKLAKQSIEEKLQEIIEKAEELTAEVQKLTEREKAKEKSSQIKGIYVGAGNNPKYFKTLLSETELNGVVIDVKEAYGSNLSNYLKNLVKELHHQNTWVIARIVVFRDSSLVEEKPEWYLKTATSTATSITLWQDEVEQYWLDPSKEEVQDYIINFSKTVVDYGFDELQFDYIRYPDNYPGRAERFQNIGDFFEKVSKALREYKPSIILSVDLFGYVATQFNSFGTGQRLVDAGKYFDYLSFMLYPSHFYGGFEVGKDEIRELPALKYSYPEVTEYPYQVVLRSVLSAKDYLSWFGYKAKIRPWLQDFTLKTEYDAEKVKAQIQAVIDASATGWLLWNPAYIYTREALE
jgi:hypothetical protein